jgi:AraC family transcriptional activator of pobA
MTSCAVLLPFSVKPSVLPPDTAAHQETPLRAERLRPALRPATLGRAGALGTHAFRAVLLSSGSARLTTADTDETMEGPSFLWSPWTAEARLVVAPGSEGRHLLLGPALLSRALRNNPNAAELGYMAERRYTVSLDPSEAHGAALAGSFDGLIAETRQEGLMSASLVEAHLSILLVTLYRAVKAGPHGLQLGPGAAPLASRFVSLVEAHLTERWTVERFCETLGVRRERLHATCLRHFGRPPGLLIRERTIIEARRLLEQSALSIDEIAQRLGFGSGPQFNRFFKALAGMPPGVYRRALRAGAEGPRPAREDLAAWP